MIARLRLLLYFIFLHCSNTTSEHSASDAGGINDYFMHAANAKAGSTATATAAALHSNFTTCPKTLPYVAPRREPETFLLEEAEGAAGNAQEGRPIPVQIGYRPGDGKRAIKRHFANNDLDYYPEVYTDDDNRSSTKLASTNN